MRIAISLLNFRPGQVGGAETYLRRLVELLPQVADGDEFFLLVFRDNADALHALGMEKVVLPHGDRRLVAARLGEAFTPYRFLPAERLLRKVAPDVVLFPQQSIFPKRTSFPAVMTVHDLQHLFYPQYFSLSHRLFRRAIYDASLRRADRIIAISQFTRRTLLERYGLAPEKILAIPHGFEPPSLASDGPTPGVPRPYLYYPAATFPHKNHAGLFETVAILRSRDQFPYKLVLSGMKTRYWSKLQRRIAALGLDEIVLHLGFLPAEQVAGLYRGAAAVLFPSQFEGFGLPILEAVAHGKPVIASRLEVFQELGLPPTAQIDFANPDHLHHALLHLTPTPLTTPPPTWPHCAHQTLHLLRDTAGV